MDKESLKLEFQKKPCMDRLRNELINMSKTVGLPYSGRNKQRLCQQLEEELFGAKVIEGVKKVPGKRKKQPSPYCKPAIRKPINGICPKEYPFLGKTSSGTDCCYKRARFGATLKTTHQIGEEYDPNIQLLLQKGILKARPSAGQKEEFILEKLMDPNDVQLIVYDLETTGLPYRDRYTGELVYPRVVQIAMYNVTTGEEFVTYVNPYRRMSLMAKEITGIDPEMLKQYPSFDQLVPQIVNFTLKDADPNTQIIMLAHNGTHFDEPTLKAEFERYWDRRPNIEDPMPLNWIMADSLELALSWINPDNIENFKESTLYQKFVGSDLEGAHDAKKDVMGLWEILSALFKDIYGRNDLPFIYAKILEYVFYSQLHDFDYLAQIVPQLVSKSQESPMDIED